MLGPLLAMPSGQGLNMTFLAILKVNRANWLLVLEKNWSCGKMFLLLTRYHYWLGNISDKVGKNQVMKFITVHKVDIKDAYPLVNEDWYGKPPCSWLNSCNHSYQGGSRCGFWDPQPPGGEPICGAPASHGLYVCRLRHTREGDAEIQALCAALDTSVLRGGKAPQGLKLNLHLSDLWIFHGFGWHRWLFFLGFWLTVDIRSWHKLTWV